MSSDQRDPDDRLLTRVPRALQEFFTLPDWTLVWSEVLEGVDGDTPVAALLHRCDDPGREDEGGWSLTLAEVTGSPGDDAQIVHMARDQARGLAEALRLGLRDQDRRH